MPGATTARLVVCAFEMPMKLFMMPQTVPNRPTKGAVAPIVASTPMPRPMRRPADASTRSSSHEMRSFKASWSGCGEICTSWIAVRSSRATVSLLAEPSVAPPRASAPR